MWCDFLIFSNSTYISSSLKNQNSRHQLGHSSVLLSYTYSSVEAQDTITSIANLPIEAMPLLRRYSLYYMSVTYRFMAFKSQSPSIQNVRSSVIDMTLDAIPFMTSTMAGHWQEYGSISTWLMRQWGVADTTQQWMLYSVVTSSSCLQPAGYSDSSEL